MSTSFSTIERQDSQKRVVMAAIAVAVFVYAGWMAQHLGLIGVTTTATVASTAHEAATHHAGHESEGSHGHHAATELPAFYSVIPFAVLLLCIALLPLFHATEHWWEGNWNRFYVAAGLGCVTLAYYALVYGHGVVDHTTHELSAPGLAAAGVVLKNALLVEYVPFICLLFSLYVISGGIAIEGRIVGRPTVNTAIIGIGGLLASFIGTTGAAMLLVRPLLKANAKRIHVAHTVVFFIFVACNTGGCLLPIGDPPLFLGFLRGVPFTWTLSLWPMWLFVNIALLGVYFVWDHVRYRGEDREAVEADDDRDSGSTGFLPDVRIRGSLNFVWLVGVIFCVALLDPSKTFPGTSWSAPPFYREIAMLGLAGLSLWFTSSAVRHANAFTYDAILEVAALFVGIFVCMQAPVQILNGYGAQLGFDTPTKFFWGTGILSSFLDNAPTYVVFFETAKVMETTGPSVAGVWVPYLVAISLGSVFMGAMTYIGNGPNFMVKAIAEAQNVRMPSFFGYMLYSCAVLLPIAAVMNWLFL